MATAEVHIHITQQTRAGAGTLDAVILQFRKGAPAPIENPHRFEQTGVRRYLFDDIETDIVLTAAESAVFQRMLNEPAVPHAGLAELFRKNP